MSQETEYAGQWWLASDPSKEVPGHLDLAGPFLELTLDSPLLPKGGPEQDLEVIHGRARGGFELTLLGAHSIRDWPIANWYLIDDAVVGGHLGVADTEFTETTVVMDHLADWVPARGIDINGSGRGEPGDKALEVSYTIQAPLEGRLDDGTEVRLATSVRTGSAPGSAFGRGITLSYAADVHWKYGTPITAQAIVAQHVAPFQELVGWATQRPVTVTAAYLRVHPDQELLTWLRKWRKPSVTSEEIRVGNIRFYATDLTPTFAAGLQRWLDILKRNSDSVDLMVSLLFSAPRFVDTSLLLVAQSLEAYHRSTLERGRWPREIFKNRTGAVLERFKDQEDRELKEWLAQVLEFAYEPTLMERLNDLHIKVEPVLGDLLALRPRWADELKKMRNRYTHRGKEGRDYEPRELDEMARFARIIFDVCVMLDIGLPAQLCGERVHGMADYSFALRDARKHGQASTPPQLSH
jgi:hypothetical protein